MVKALPLIARIFIALIFLIDGLFKIIDFNGAAGYAASFGVPLPQVALVIAIILTLLGSISLILGYKTVWGAALLVIFLIPVTLIFHTNFADQVQMIQFMKNLAIIGALLLVMYFGPGPISIDGE